MSDLYLGLDPGKSGACCLRFPDGSLEYFRFDKGTPAEFFDWLAKYSANIKFGLLEKVSSSPQMGVVSAFSFGESFGMVQGILVGAEIPFAFIAPVKWQRALGCLSRGDKNITKRRAQELFPQYRKQIVHANADAILLAEHCYQTYR